MRVFCDMDGVLCDFVLGTAKLFGFDPSVVTMWNYFPAIGHTEQTFWEGVRHAGSDFWADLPPYEWHDELQALCKHYDDEYVLLTSPSHCPSSLHGKLRWMHRMYGPRFNSYLIGSRKERCAHPGAVLIDDSDSNCRKFVEHGGEAILFPQPWNANRGITDRMAYVAASLAAFRQRLTMQAAVV